MLGFNEAYGPHYVWNKGNEALVNKNTVEDIVIKNHLFQICAIAIVLCPYIKQNFFYRFNILNPRCPC